MKHGDRFLFYYSAFFALFIALTSVVTGIKKNNLLSAVVFAPVALYFLIELSRRIFSARKNKTSPPPRKTNILPALIILLLLTGISVKRIISQAPAATTIPKVPETNTPEPIVNFDNQPSKESQIEKATNEKIENLKTQNSQQFIVVDLESKDHRANIRDNPSTSGKIIKKAQNQQKFPLLEESDDWYKIELENGSVGWVSAGVAVVIENKEN